MESASLESSEKKQGGDATTLHDDTGATTSPNKLKSPIAGDGTKAARCKKHSAHAHKSKSRPKSKKSHKRAQQSSDSDSTDSTSTSSSSEESEDSDSSGSDSESSDSDERKKKRRRAKTKAKKEKNAKKNRSKKKSIESSTDESSGTDDEDGDESSMDDKTGKKSAKSKSKTRAKAKRAAKHKAEETAETEEVAEGNSTETRLQNLEDQLQQLAGKAGTRATPATKRRPLKTPRSGLGSLASRDSAAVDDTVTQKKSRKKTKRASKIAFKRVDQLWDSSIHNYKLTETADDPNANEWDQYIFTVRRQFDFENKFEASYVDVRSKPLKDALQHVLEDVKGISLVSETPALDPNMLFLFLEEMRSEMSRQKRAGRKEKRKKARKSAVRKAQHLKVLVKFLDTEFAQTKKTLYPLLKDNLITFDLLWALYKPNTIVYTPTYNDNEQSRAFKVDFSVKQSSFMKGTWYYVEGGYLEYTGSKFGMGTVHAEVPSFKGSRNISSLSCYPINYHKNVEALKTKLIERGKKFVALKGMNYRYHQGMAYMKKKRAVLKINIAGRVMIDPQTHRRINPNYQVSTVRPKEDDDSFSMSDDSDDGSCDCCAGSSGMDHGEKDNHGPSDDEKPRKKRFKLVENENGDHQLVEINMSDDENEERTTRKEKVDNLAHRSKEDSFTDEELLIASPVVLGFAFSEKLWLEFTVSGIRDVEWNEGAYDSLVLPENHKSIVKSLVTSHKFSAAKNIDDVITGKGKGLVAILHGPPGVGKTLTAEGIAELLKCPLYMVSAGELGTDPRVLERSLTDILDIAHAWGAVLLLDEADVFLEKRSIHDIHRNALVSIFLRLLEYFQGILFLTTNRVETFDDAFQSRIHVALKYGDLSTKARRSVWKMFVDKVRQVEGVEVAEFRESDFDTLAKQSLNGRQIKNSTRAAQALALSEKKPFAMSHLTRVLQVAQSFEQDLKGGTGYEDAMRSYT